MRDLRQPEERLNHLPLFGHAEPALDRPRGLRLQREIGGPTAATDAAAAPVKQRGPNLMSPAGVDDGLLRLEQLPARAESSDILRRVGVADHDLLQAVDARAIPVDCKAVDRGSAGARRRSAAVSSSGTTRSGRSAPISFCSNSTTRTSDA